MKRSGQEIRIGYKEGTPAEIVSIQFRETDHEDDVLDTYTCFMQSFEKQPLYRIHLNSIVEFVSEILMFRVAMPTGKVQFSFRKGKLIEVRKEILTKNEIKFATVKVDKRSFAIMESFLSKVVKVIGTQKKEIRDDAKK